MKVGAVKKCSLLLSAQDMAMNLKIYNICMEMAKMKNFRIPNRKMAK